MVHSFKFLVMKTLPLYCDREPNWQMFCVILNIVHSSSGFKKLSDTN